MAITLPARWIIFNSTPLLKINSESENAYTLEFMLKPCHHPYQRCITTQSCELITTYLHSSRQLSRNMSLVIGLTRYVILVQRRTLRTRPSRPMLKSTTRPKGHAPRGAFSSMINTTSPTLRFGFFSNHFGGGSVQLGTVKPVYNDHLMGYFSAFWSSSRWPSCSRVH